MHHVLTVGEIYDKAIDLCLRNAGKIALFFGVFSLIENASSVIVSNSKDYSILTKLHQRQHPLVAINPWYSWVEGIGVFLLLPIVVAALFSLFDHARQREKFRLRDCFRFSLRYNVNVVVAAFLTQVYLVMPVLAIVLLYRVVAFWNQPAITIPLGIVAFTLATWLTGLLALGVGLGFGRVTLDAGRPVESLRFGTTYVFARRNQRRALMVGIPLAVIVILGNFGGAYAGIIAYGLTGSDVAMILIVCLGEVTAWSILAAVSVVYYRCVVASES